MPKKTRHRATAERSSEFYAKVDYTDIGKVTFVEPEDGVRLYCSSSGAWWHLQVRGMLRRADRSLSKNFIVATASLPVETMRALRDAITAQLKRDGLK